MIRKHLAVAVGLVLGTSAVHAGDWREKLTPQLLARVDANETVDVLIRVRGEAPLQLLDQRAEFSTKVANAAQQLQLNAEASQYGLRIELAARGVAFKPFWVANLIAAHVSAQDLKEIATREDVIGVESDRVFRNVLPDTEFDANAAPDAIAAVEASVARVRAPETWAAGFRGQGVVIAGADTGYQWDHSALKAKYRGWNGTVAAHAYNWHDSIHALLGSGTNPCGLNAAAPCDDNSHGTHTMGTMVGDDGAANQIGVAPDAKWIACRNMERGNGRPSTYIECFQWFIAPTDAANANPDSTKAPHIISNSWGCPLGPPPNGEDCALNSIESTVSNVKAAGILVVVAAGNGTPGCGTIADPPAIYANSFVVAATNNSDVIASFSLWGPITADGSNRLKPDVAAPGVSVRSAVPTNTYGSKSGTSMATPNVAGVAALLMSAKPELRGNPAAVEQILRNTAVHLTSASSCTGFPGSVSPNVIFGYGRVDALAAVQAVLAPNTNPTIDTLSDLIVLEDGATAARPFNVGDVETPAGSLTLQGQSSDIALVPTASVVLGGAGAARTVQTTPAANRFGTTTITVKVTDGNGATTGAPFLLTVTPVNDAPSIVLLGNRTHSAGSTGAQTASGFVNSVNFGPNESAQSVLGYTVIESSDPASVVSAASVNTAGDLSYTLSGVSGTASLTVAMQDNGGIANGGVDTSPPVPFTITVTALLPDPLFADGYE